ncbi:hypothetical protein [Nocardia sp. NPDC051570]|uniref:hypothetical protein n=1 Tax=Nocardia sp. NPDC051570 TaxID=3364324 RepID=UPI003793C9A7
MSPSRGYGRAVITVFGTAAIGLVSAAGADAALPAGPPQITTNSAPDGGWCDDRIPLLLLAGTAGMVGAVRTVRGQRPSGSIGLPIPDSPASIDPSVDREFGTIRIYLGVRSQAEFSAIGLTPDLPAPGQPDYRSSGSYWRTLLIDPDRTPGSIGPWSATVLASEPGLGHRELTIAVSGGKKLRIDADTRIQLRIIGMHPITVIPIHLAGQRALAVTYQYQYQVRAACYEPGDHAITRPTPWQNIPIHQVRQLQRIGADVPSLSYL